MTISWAMNPGWLGVFKLWWLGWSKYVEAWMLMPKQKWLGVIPCAIFAWLEESAGDFQGLNMAWHPMKRTKKKPKGKIGHAKVYLARNQRRGHHESHSKVHNYPPGKHRKNYMERSTMLSMGTSTNFQWSFSSSQTVTVITRGVCSLC